jgi:hypothetical protein
VPEVRELAAPHCAGRIVLRTPLLCQGLGVIFRVLLFVHMDVRCVRIYTLISQLGAPHPHYVRTCGAPLVPPLLLPTVVATQLLGVRVTLAFCWDQY